MLDSPRWVALLRRLWLVVLLPLRVRTLPLAKRKSGPSVGKEEHTTRMQPSPRPSISRSGTGSNKVSSVLRNVWSERLTSRVLGQYYKDFPKDCEFVNGEDEGQDTEAQRDRDQDAVLEQHVETHNERNRVQGEEYI